MPCPRCHGTAIDPEHSGCEYYGDALVRPVPEPCTLCQYSKPDAGTPYGCLVCGDPEYNHGWQFDSEAGLHQWIRPTNAQILARMRARRTARLTAPKPKYHATTGWDPAPDGESADPYCANCASPACSRWSRIQARLNHHRWGAPYRTKHGLNATTDSAGSWGGDDTNLPF